MTDRTLPRAPFMNRERVWLRAEKAAGGFEKEAPIYDHPEMQALLAQQARELSALHGEHSMERVTLGLRIKQELSAPLVSSAGGPTGGGAA